VPSEVTHMDHQDTLSPAALRAELSPVSERFAAVALGSAVIVFDRDDTDRWICSDTTVDRGEMR